MSEGQDIDCIVRHLMAVERNIAAIAKCDHQLTEQVISIKRSPDSGVGFQQRQFLRYRPASAPRRIGIALGQKSTTTRDAEGSALGYDQSWHSGRPDSLSDPQLSSQVSVSAPVRWRPVS